MKILSLLQPWSQLMVTGQKLVDTRSWNTSYRGPLFIHASGEINKRMKQIGLTPLETATSNEHFRRAIINPNLMITGKIIGMVYLDQVFKVENEPPPSEYFEKLTVKEIAFGNYELGRYMFFCSRAVEFKIPIICKGKLSITDAPKTGCRLCDEGDIPVGDYHNRKRVTDGERFQVPCYNMIKP